MPEATGNPLAKALLIIAICVRSFTYRTAACGPSAINASIEPTRPTHHDSPRRAEHSRAGGDNEPSRNTCSQWPSSVSDGGRGNESHLSLKIFLPVIKNVLPVITGSRRRGTGGAKSGSSKRRVLTVTDSKNRAITGAAKCFKPTTAEDN